MRSLIAGLRGFVAARLARVDWGDAVIRARRTFWQAAVPAVPIAAWPALESGDYRGAFVLAIPPLAAALSLAWNTVVRPAAAEVFR